MENIIYIYIYIFCLILIIKYKYITHKTHYKKINISHNNTHYYVKISVLHFISLFVIDFFLHTCNMVILFLKYKQNTVFFISRNSF